MTVALHPQAKLGFAAAARYYEAKVGSHSLQQILTLANGLTLLCAEYWRSRINE